MSEFVAFSGGCAPNLPTGVWSDGRCAASSDDLCRLSRRQFIGRAAAASGALALPTLGPVPAWAQVAIDEGERRRIEEAIPATAPVRPAKARRLLVFYLNVGYPGKVSRFPGGVYPGHVKDFGHCSIAHANLAFELMGRRTGAFEAVLSRDPTVFEPRSLRQFDAVVFNNTVGNLFDDVSLRESLLDFVYGGGGMMGIHGASVAFTRWPGAKEDWPEFGRMLGARGAAHMPGNGEEHIFIRRDDATHPLSRSFGDGGFDYRSEFFRVQEPYSRNRVRVLLSIDNARTEQLQGGPLKRFREDDDYALAWVRNYGRGRIFYSTIGHNPYIFWDRRMLEFYLAAAQFALGDLPAPTIPSGKLTPAIRAQEELGWRLGIGAGTFQELTLHEAIEKTADLGLPFVGGLSVQRVSADIAKNFDPQLSDDELARVRLMLDEAGVRMLTYCIDRIPDDAARCRRVFEFGRKIGVETLVSEPAPEALDAVERLCDEYGINVAIHNGNLTTSPQYRRPEGVLKACEGRSMRLGACGDLGHWMRSGIDPVEALRKLKERLITVRMHDLNAGGAEGHDVPWGSGVGNTAEFLREVRRLGLRPTMFGIEYPDNGRESLSQIGRCIDFFNNLTMDMIQRGEA